MQDGAPPRQPTPPIGSEPRYVVGAGVDLGAFEFGNAAPLNDDVPGTDGDGGTGSGGKGGGCCEVDGGGGATALFGFALVAAGLRRRRRR